MAVVRLRTAANTCTVTPLALGAKQGVVKLNQALDNGIDADEKVKQALKDVVAGSAKGASVSAHCALRCWAAFSDAVLHAEGNHMPATAEGLACWSRLFRNVNTFAYYIGYLRLGCHVLGLDTGSSYGPLLQRAKQEMRRRQGTPRKKRLVREAMFLKLMDHAFHEDNATVAMLSATAYISYCGRPPNSYL